MSGCTSCSGSCSGSCSCSKPRRDPCAPAPNRFEGCSARVPSDCAGGDCTTVIDPQTGQPVPAPGICGPGPENVPNTDGDLVGSLGVCLQTAVDGARGIVHDLGLRGYRVWLVWRKRDRKQRAEELRRVELFPVLVSSTAAIDWESSFSGMRASGDIVLTEISPAQVSGRELFGYIDDRTRDPDVEFFYEVERRERCPSDPNSVPGRFTPASLPYYDAENFQYVITLTDQEGARTEPPPIGVPDRDGSYQTERDTNAVRPRISSLRT